MFPTFVDLLFAFSFVTRYVSGYALPAPKTLGLGDLAARTADAVEPTITPKPHQKRFMAYPYAGIWQNYKQHGGDISTPIHVEPAFVVAGKNYNNTCMLWNDKCDGNRNQALVEFFNESMPALMADNCFAEPSQKFECFYACSTCTKQCFSCPASSASNWNQIRSFLRGPSISSAYSEAIDLGAAAGAPLMYAPCGMYIQFMIL